MATSSLLLPGIENPAASPWPAHARKTTSSTDVDDAAGDDVEADAGDRFGRRDPGLLHVADVERHPADVGRRHAVDERRRQGDLHASARAAAARRTPPIMPTAAAT